MAPGILIDHVVESQPAKRRRLSHGESNEPAHGESNQPAPSDDDDSTPSLLPPHPLHVKPSYNAYTASSNHKTASGLFAQLPDELLHQLLETLDAAALVALGSTCRALYAFARADEIWRGVFVGSPPSTFTWRGTWRATYLNTPADRVTAIPCPNLFSDVLYRPFQCAHTPLEAYTRHIPARNAIARLPDLTPDEFSAHWTDRPFILTEPVKAWPVFGSWTPESLLERFGDTKFRAEAVDWPLRTYMEYLGNNADESPLYLFDRDFAAKTHIDTTLPPHHPSAAYWTPPCFGPDLFAELGPARPDCRWLILGPARSGSTFHKDPNATSAWNAVLTGAKYWLMFPPSDTTPPGIILSEDQAEITAPLSIPEYLLAFHELARASPGAREGICYAGEVLHVPSGWFHLVLNLSTSLALTQNFVPRAKLPDVLGFLRDRRDQVSGFADEVADRAYEVFVDGLRESMPDVLREGLEALERRDKQGRGKWEALTRGDEGGFSFGFAGDDSDAEIP